MAVNPKVILAGKEYEVAPLVLLQNENVVPALMKLTEFFKQEGEDKGSFIKKNYAEAMNTIAVILYWGALWPNDINRAVKFDQIKLIPWTLAEAYKAVDVIRMQTGLYDKAPEGAAPGESQTASAA